jgi:enoyl-[acyl-carrier protein] reductase II
MNTKESPVHETMKKLSIEKQIYDTIYTPKVDGLPARFMKSEIALKMAKRPLNLITAAFNSREIAKSLGFPWFKLAIAILLSGYGKARQMATMANGFKAFKAGTTEGDTVGGVLPLGQVTGLINDTPGVKQVIERIIAEAKAVKKKVGPMIG